MERFNAGSATEIVRTLEGSDLVAQGCVNLISLEAIKAKTGERWSRKSEQVWEFTEKKLHQRLEVHDLVVRVNDTDYMVAVSAEHPSAAQAVCMRVLEEVLLYFLGRVDRADIVLKRVTSVDGGDIGWTPLDVARIPSLEESSSNLAARLQKPRPEEAERNPIVLTSISGIALQVDFFPLPVTSLKQGHFVALYIDRVVTDVALGKTLSRQDLELLADADVARIDASTLDYARLFLTDTEEAGPTALMAPVSYRTLAGSRGRAALLTQGAGSRAFKTGVILELRDVSHGTPHSRVAEIVGIGKTLARGVVARVPTGPGDLSCLKNVGLSGLTVDLRKLRIPGLSPTEALVTMGERLSKISRSLTIMNVRDSRWGSELRQYGFTHMCLQAAAGLQANSKPAPRIADSMSDGGGAEAVM